MKGIIHKEYNVGSEVYYFDRKYIIRRVIDLDKLMVADAISGELHTLNIKDLTLHTDNPNQSKPELMEIPNKTLTEAKRRLEAIKPLLNIQSSTIAEVKQCASAANVDISTIYRWLNQYLSTKNLSSLLPRKRTGGKGKSRINPEIELIIQDVIDELYFLKQQNSINKHMREITKRCKAAHLKPPHINTLRNRIKAVAEYKKNKLRYGKKKGAKNDAMPGEFPGADWPLAYVQIDHTLVDIELVDDIHRLPIGRPWITVAIDVFSRVVTGYYISLDTPGSLGTGLCIAHSILPKEDFLLKFKTKTPWPVWGLMQNIHMDNASEFRGNMIHLGCQEYGINLHWRPVAQPRYGAHIERLLGSFGNDIHDLPGTTFSNPEKLGEYNSEKNSVFTLSEFDSWLAIYITGIYHQKNHSSLNMSPIEKYKRGILGEGDQPGIGLPERHSNPDRLRIDFMPLTKRTVQNYGIKIEGIQYYSDVLRPWINSKDPETGLKRKFLIRKDPRDISIVYFYDPELEDYFIIPYRNSVHPAISLWELREVQRRLKQEGRDSIDENLIFETYEILAEVEIRAKAETKKTRRKKQRKKEHTNMDHPSAKNGEEIESTYISNDIIDIKPFEDIDEEF